MTADGRRNPGAEARQTKGLLAANKWLIARRLSQAGFLGLFLAGPLTGVWIAKGTIASSLTFDVLPLTDPFMLLQSLAAGHVMGLSAIIGAVIVLAVYAVIGGRMYCSWVCPINPVTDGAHRLRETFGIDKGWQPDRRFKYGVLGAALIVSAVTGTIAWEAVNPVMVAYRGIVFATLFAGFGWTIILAVFLFDLLISRHGWCGHLCPVGAFYGLVGRFSLLRVSATARTACDDCMDCYAVCPEPQVITPALKPKDAGVTPVVLSADCTNCGRCIDVCSKNVYRFTHRFDARLAPPAAGDREKVEAAA
jgi:ferredoxin-type protein NapH